MNTFICHQILKHVSKGGWNHQGIIKMGDELTQMVCRLHVTVFKCIGSNKLILILPPMLVARFEPRWGFDMGYTHERAWDFLIYKRKKYKQLWPLLCEYVSGFGYWLYVWNKIRQLPSWFPLPPALNNVQSLTTRLMQCTDVMSVISEGL